MNRTLFLVLIFVFALFRPGSSGAQYLYLDSNGDGVHTDDDVVSTSGTTHVDVWLDTDHDRGGSLQTCNSHTGAPADPQESDIDVFGYDLYLIAEHGTVDWGSYQDCMGFKVLPGDAANTRTETAIHITRWADLGDEKPAGHYRLGSMTVTTTAGTPLIRFGLMSAWDFTSFATHCAASRQWNNSYVYGTDFYDVDGLRYGGPINHEPVFENVASFTVIQDHPLDVPLFASDEDLQPLTFSKVSGPDFLTVSDLPINGQGNLHAAPGNSDVGVFVAHLRVSDGVFYADRFVSFTVKRELTLAPISDVTIQAGSGQNRYLYVDNPLNSALAFAVISGPPFVTVHNEAFSTPYVSLAPEAGDVGSYDVTLGVSGGTAHDEMTFHVVVTADPVANPNPVNHPPVAVIQGPSDGVAGRAVRLDGSGSKDPDGGYLSFAWDFGDGSPISSDLRPQHRYASEGDYPVQLTVHDQQFYRTAAMVVHVAPAAVSRGFLDPSSAVEVRVEPVGGSFALGELTEKDLASFSLSNEAGRAITAIGIDTSDRDADRNGTPERGLRFAADDVTLLLSGSSTNGIVPLTLRGALAGGGQFAASLALKQNGRRGPLSVSLSPNPFNPAGHLTFVTRRTGRTDVKVFDIAGRLAAHPLSGAVLPAGFHDVIVGRGLAGADLPSGHYFYRVEAEEGVAVGRFAIVR